ncbi:hypothetical protein KY290_035745 [Solanum tuberosum]|uniref:Uncharacterized protein n=1 Tax=Solanum tuberosum TaxID=4113 RepID=A0ABQ7TRH0_SOLTU|nr:hypothetical protein KY290_035745 [Solanum tuberosum]
MHTGGHNQSTSWFSFPTFSLTKDEVQLKLAWMNALSPNSEDSLRFIVQACFLRQVGQVFSSKWLSLPKGQSQSFMSPWIMLTTFCFTSVVQAGIILLLAAQEGG